MNIFTTSACPVECAKSLDDKRVVKMVLESTQMLCTALNELAGKQIAPYKSTHVNHPCNLWARERLANWLWLHEHAVALSKEYTARYNKVHKCHDILNQLIMLVKPSHFSHMACVISDFPNCARNKSLDLDFTDMPVHEAYQHYLNARWELDKREPTWYGK